MRWTSALSQNPRLRDAAAEACDAAKAGLGGERADLVVAFASAGREIEELPRLVSARFPGALVVGCSGGGVIGGGREVEDGAALSVTAARLPGVTLRPLRVDSADECEEPGTWRQSEGPASGGDPAFLLLADAFTLDPDALISGLDAAYPRSAKVGGLASSGLEEGENRLWVGEDVYAGGAVGVALEGNVSVEAVVAQGCRPIGPPQVITRCQRNLVHELDGRTPMRVLEELYASLPDTDQEVFERSLLVGMEMEEPGGGSDFLVRQLIAVHPQSGSMAIAAVPKEGQVLRFHLRDARAADEDLCQRLGRLRRGSPEPSGALLFSCVARGEQFFGCRDHDSAAFRRLVGGAPLGGFFCNGEIGPVGGHTFLHGFTSAFALFSPRAGVH